MTLDPGALLTRSPDIVASEVDGELVLVSVQDGKYYGLDPVGSEIWRQLEQPRTVTALTAALQQHFDGDAATIERETVAFIDQLAAQALVTVA